MTVLVFLTIVSMVIAVVMSVVAWRVSGEERRRSDARVATLTADIYQGDFDLRPAASEGGEAVPVTADLFATAQPATSGARLATVAVFGVLVVGTLATAALLLGSGPHGAAAAAAAENHAVADGAAGATRANPVPLELVALGHERDADRLTVRGVVRNPPSGAVVDGVAAVIFLFGKDGSFITSGRADVESARLAPGSESRFVVTVPAATDVGRYRVSFRTDDRVIPHVDRREPALAKR